MDRELKLTAKGHAIFELMSELGLTLEAACARVDRDVEILRQRVELILNESAWEDVPRAMQAALHGVSARVQSAYLEESARRSMNGGLPSHAAHEGASVH